MDAALKESYARMLSSTWPRIPTTWMAGLTTYCPCLGT